MVPRGDLDLAVDAMAAKLLQRLPEVVRYTRQQLNFWRDLSWHLTVQHARDWLSIHSASAEVAEGLAAFHEKRRVDVDGLRQRLVEGEAWTCAQCGHILSSDFAFCGHCGTKRGMRNEE